MTKFSFETDGTVEGTKIKLGDKEIQSDIQSLYLDFYRNHEGEVEVCGNLNLKVDLGNGLSEQKNLQLKVKKEEDE